MFWISDQIHNLTYILQVVNEKIKYGKDRNRNSLWNFCSYSIACLGDGSFNVTGRHVRNMLPALLHVVDNYMCSDTHLSHIYLTETVTKSDIFLFSDAVHKLSYLCNPFINFCKVIHSATDWLKWCAYHKSGEIDVEVATNARHELFQRDPCFTNELILKCVLVKYSQTKNSVSSVCLRDAVIC